MGYVHYTGLNNEYEELDDGESEAVEGRLLLQEGDGKADDRNMQGWKLVILLKFVVVELLEILSVKNCIS